MNETEISPLFSATEIVGVLIFTMTVTDSLAIGSQSDEVQITIKNPTFSVYLPILMMQP